MKLHLPLVLMAAVFSAAVYGDDSSAPKYTYKYIEEDGVGKTTFTGNGYNIVIGDSAYECYRNYGSGTPLYTALEGAIGGIRRDDEDKKADSVEITVTGEGTRLNLVSGTGPDYYYELHANGSFKSRTPYEIAGNKSITVTDGAYVRTIYGGSYDRTVNTTGKTGSITEIKVSQGAMVGRIIGGAYSSSNAGAEVTTKEKVVINVQDGTVGALWNEASQRMSYQSNGELAIMGGAYYKTVIDNDVEINISNEAKVYGSIYGGSSADYGNVGSVKSTKITVSGGTIEGNVYGGGLDYRDTAAPNDIAVTGSTSIILSGGTINGDVYGAGRGDSVSNGTEIIIDGEGSQVSGTVYCCGVGSTISGNRNLTVTDTHDSSNQEQGYKLADFTGVVVNGDIKIESLGGVKDDEGNNVTEVTVGETGSISAKAGALMDLKSLKVEGALNIDVSDAEAGKSAITCGDLSLDGATINVVAVGAGASDAILVLAFDSSNEDAGEFTLTMNGLAVDEELWGFEDGVLFIKEASTTTLNLNRNQSHFHDALSAMQEDGNATPELAALATARDEAAVKAGIDALSGHECATAMSSQIEGNLGHLRRLKSAMGKGTALGCYVVSPGSKGTVDEKGNEVMAAMPAVTDIRNWRVGASAFHEETSIDSDASGDGYDRSETGAMLTAEFLMNKEITLGGALSYGRTNLRVDGAARRHEDNTRMDVYALYGKKRWSFATSLGLGIHEHELLGGDADGYSINFLQDAAYTVLSCEVDNVQVFGTIESSWNEIDGFSDGLISGASQNAWATDVTVGLRYNRALRALGNAPAGVFSVQTGVTASIGDIKGGVDMSIGGYGYRQESATRNRWGWNLGAGVDVPVRTNVSVYGAVDAVIRGDSSSMDGQIGVKVSF